MDNVTGTFETRLLTALESVERTPADGAAVELALTYARLIDAEPTYAAKVGPALLSTLESLLMTPRARAAVVKGANPDERKQLSPLDELRARRANRAG